MDGFKKTEIGWIPEDWEVKKIKDIASVITGSKNTQDKIDTGIYPFFVRSQVVERINTYSLDCEGVLTAGDGVGTGKVFHYINGKFDFHQRVYLIYNFNRVNGRFFYKYFSNNFYRRMMQMTAKSSVDSVRREMITEMYIPVPANNEEQEAIAKALTDVDNLIDTLERKIAKKRNIKQGAMQRLLTGKHRLPGFSGEWVERKLGEIGFFKNGNGFPLKYQNMTEGSIPFFKVSDFNNRGNEVFMLNANNYITNKIRIEIGANLIPANAILIAKIGAAIFLERKKIVFSESCIDNNMMAFIPSQADNLFVYFLFQTFKLSDYANTTALPSLSGKDILEKNIYLPKDISEQTSIAKILTDMDKEIAILEQKLEKYKKIKQGMMQELLTGRIRLVKPQ